MPHKNVTLLNGHEVRIAYTDEQRPPVHEEAMDDQVFEWGSGRKALKFYDSTVEYMRNDWVEETARSAEVEHDGQTLLLFFDERTRTWNSAEALDIDHKTPWEQHFADVEVHSRADALLAYNDADNLRTVPATYNRARVGADAILDTHGADSDQWRDWVERKMRFDPGKDYPEYDPEVHGTQRNAKTLNAEWTPGAKRDGLSFDEGIKTVWMDHALKEAYSGEVKVPDPDHPDDRAKDHAVQLFTCAATGQLVTRGGLDVDHALPFSVALDDMQRQYNQAQAQALLDGTEPPAPLSKAEVLDLYNDPSNLRLMSRSANSAHEWELGIDGQYYDPELDGEVAYGTDEPLAMVVDDDAPILYEDDAPVVDPGLGAIGVDAPVVSVHMPLDVPLGVASGVPSGIALDTPVGDDALDPPTLGGDGLAPSKKRLRGDEGDDSGDVFVPDDDQVPAPLNKRGKADLEDAVHRTPREDALLAMQGRDVDLYRKVVGEVGRLDPAVVGPLTEPQRENLAMSLVSFARQNGLADIDHVLAARENGQPFGRVNVFGVEGPLDVDTGKKAWIPLEIFKNQPMEVTARLMTDPAPTFSHEPAFVDKRNTGPSF